MASSNKRQVERCAAQISGFEPALPRRTRAGVNYTLQTNDIVVKQAHAVNALVAAVRFNATKKFEYGHDRLFLRRAIALANLLTRH